MSLSVWEEFEHDPRSAANAGLRASDDDRDVVQRLLSRAYGEGRLDAEEIETRGNRLVRARTLAELRPLIDDLVPAGAGSGSEDRDALRRKATRRYVDARNSAVASFLIPAVVCLVVYLWTARDGWDFPWPVFVIIGTGMHLANILLNRERIIACNLAKLERRRLARRPAPDRLDTPVDLDKPVTAG